MTNETQDQAQDQAPAPVQTWQPIADAFASSNPAEALLAIPSTDTTFKTAVAAFIALSSLLPADSPAVLAQKAWLEAYKPKASRVPAADKWTPKLALNKLVKAKPIDLAALAALATDPRVPAAMATAIVTYTTLAGAESVPDDVKEFVLSQLRKHGLTTHTGSRKAAVKVTVTYDNQPYDTLMAAIKAAGFSADNKVGESNRPETELVWGRVRPHLLKGDSYSYTHAETGKVYVFGVVKAEADEKEEQAPAPAPEEQAAQAA